MRDPNCLVEFYKALQVIHMTKFPDQRFGQFVTNLERWVGQKYDFFYLEESEMLILLKQLAEGRHEPYLKESKHEDQSKWLGEWFSKPSKEHS